MDAQLTIHNAEQPVETFILRGHCAIGRGSGNDLVLDDPRVSRNHALLRRSGDGGYYLIDLGSSNGTFLNGRILTVPAALRPGDAIELGHRRLVFHAPQAQPPSPGPSGMGTTMGTMTDLKCEQIGILVVDVRNYTRLTEALPPAELSQWMGRWFKEASQRIEREGGVIDKFIGDAVMAWWRRADKSDTRHVTGPLAVANELITLARNHHETLHAKHPALSFAIGCGIHVGEAMLGNPGGLARRDFTAMGDCVNAAFRIESLCKPLQRTLVVSQRVKELADPALAFEDLGMHPLKGKREQMRLFAPAG